MSARRRVDPPGGKVLANAASFPGRAFRRIRGEGFAAPQESSWIPVRWCNGILAPTASTRAVGAARVPRSGSWRAA